MSVDQCREARPDHLQGRGDRAQRLRYVGSDEVTESKTAGRTGVYIVVDIEASGPSPWEHALLSIGACTLGEPRETFYTELQPDQEGFTSEAMTVHGLALDELWATGTPPEVAMKAFADWVQWVVPEGAQPIFTAFNAPFDWMFVNVYFHRYLGQNPFGHKALDMKAYFMGLHGVSWEETSHSHIGRRYSEKTDLSHHALADAIDEAELFEAMLAEQKRQRDEERK